MGGTPPKTLRYLKFFGRYWYIIDAYLPTSIRVYQVSSYKHKYLFHFFHFVQVPPPQNKNLGHFPTYLPFNALHPPQPPNNTGDTPSASVRDPEISPCAVAICVGAAVAAKELAVGNTAKAKMQPKGGRKAWKTTKWRWLFGVEKMYILWRGRERFGRLKMLCDVEKKDVECIVCWILIV